MTHETQPTQPEPGRAIYLALFLVTAATLLLELGLTRIFSVLMYYHMAFFAVSVTLFGLSFGAVAVHFFPRLFAAERVHRWMTYMSLAFSVTTVAALVTLLGVPFAIQDNAKLAGQLVMAGVVIALPFACSGVCIALALTRFPRRTNLLYGFDLAGSAAGCLFFSPLMTWLGGPGFVLFVALLAALAAAGLAAAHSETAWGRRMAEGAAILAAIVAGLVWQAPNIKPLQLRKAHGYPFAPEGLIFDKWNSISRVTVYHSPKSMPTGVSKALAGPAEMDQHFILLDTVAGTPIIPFDGSSFEKLYYPFHDVSYAAHAVRKNARVAVIGVGGGRDILAAKAWGQPEVVGVEINARVLEALTEKFHDYAGRPLQWPGVKIVHDEARSYISRSREPFDIIQASLIDTFAATSAGAFVLTENSLYTLEGWKVFLDHLGDNGILSMTRWHSRGVPVESIRLLALARASLESRGVKRPQDHMLYVLMDDPALPEWQPLGTLLVKKTPFTGEEVVALENWAKENQFKTLVTPLGVSEPKLRGVLEAADVHAYARGFQFDISPPTDNRPFFFDVLRWRDIAKREYREGTDYIFSINFKPLVMLGTLLLTVIAMALAFIVVPLLIERVAMRGTVHEVSAGRRFGRVIYFVLLGLSYLMVELSLIQRFAVFLGHPSYSLTVCLFSMLLSSGAGAAVAPRLFGFKSAEAAPPRLAALNFILCGVLLATLAAAQAIMAAFASASTPARIALAGGVLVPAAFFMGMPLPLALQAASARPGAPLAWYWGINGAFSVAASVAVVAIAHTIGLNGAFLCGTACYFLAGLASRAFGPDTRSNEARVEGDSGGIPE